ATLGAVAVDLGSNTGMAQDVQISVIPDPKTIVIGRVVDANQNPVSGATLSTLGGVSGTTLGDGTFSISGAPTVLGNIIVSATSTDANGIRLSGTSAGVPPLRGGITDVGTIVVAAVTTGAFQGTVRRSAGVPVTTGTVLVVDETRGFGAESPIASDGTYLVSGVP